MIFKSLAWLGVTSITEQTPTVSLTAKCLVGELGDISAAAKAEPVRPIISALARDIFSFGTFLPFRQAARLRFHVVTAPAFHTRQSAARSNGRQEQRRPSEAGLEQSIIAVVE